MRASALTPKYGANRTFSGFAPRPNRLQLVLMRERAQSLASRSRLAVELDANEKGGGPRGFQRGRAAVTNDGAREQSSGDQLHDPQTASDRRKGKVLATLNRAYLLSLDARTRAVREEGQALVEYALILAMIAVVTIAVLQALGVDVSKILDKVATSLSSAAG